MARLTARELRVLLHFLRQQYGVHDLDGFVGGVLEDLAKVIPADLITYNEMNPAAATSRDRLHPPERWTAGLAEAWTRTMHQHPVLRNYLKTGDGQAFKVSDFLSRAHFRRLALYAELYRPLGVEHLLCIALPTPRPLVIGIAVHRGGRSDFSEHDRLLLNTLRPHLAEMYQMARLVTRFREEHALFLAGFDAVGHGVIVLGPERRVIAATASTMDCVSTYFGGGRRKARRLPNSVEEWVRRQEKALDDDDSPPRPQEPLIAERGGNRLLIRLVTGGSQQLLLVEEQATELDPQSLESLGITRREAQVLAWVTEGKTNAEIGIILGISARTVQTHLEGIRRKLDVETRTAAATRALQHLGHGIPGGRPPSI